MKKNALESWYHCMLWLLLFNLYRELIKKEIKQKKKKIINEINNYLHYKGKKQPNLKINE